MLERRLVKSNTARSHLLYGATFGASALATGYGPAAALII